MGSRLGARLPAGCRTSIVERVSFKGTDQGIRIKSARDRGNDVSNISYKDITMVDVKTAILVTEYYPFACARRGGAGGAGGTADAEVP